MALTFGAATSDRVTINAATSINNLDPYTVIMWVYPTTLTSGRRYWHKGISTNKRISITATTANITVSVGRAGGTLDYVTSDSPITVNTWHFIAITVNSADAANNLVDVYHGTETTVATESTYSTTTDSSGAFSDDSSAGMFFGNRNGADSSFQGHIAFGAVWNRELTLAEIKDQQFFPHPTSGCVEFQRYNNSTVGTQLDQSGNQNHGTVTGATVTTIADPVNVIFNNFPKINKLRPRVFAPGLAR